MDLSKLALTGLLGGALTLTGCSEEEPAKAADGAKTDAHAAHDAAGDAAKEATVAFSDVHACAGKNTCKGLGGCKVTEEKLAKLAAKVGTSADAAGSAHACAGKNACKGLGGCAVTAEKFAELKAAVDGAGDDGAPAVDSKASKGG